MISLYPENFQKFDSLYRTTFFNTLSGFKGAFILGTYSKTGIPNLGLFNSIFHVGANPPLMGLVVRPDGPDHDTLKNIEESGQYTLNVVSQPYLLEAHQTSARFPSGVSEFEPCGLKEWKSPSGMGPFVLESPILIGLAKKEIIPIASNGTRIVIGQVIETHFQKEEFLTEDGFIDFEKANIVSVLGLDAYYLPQFQSRLSYAKPYTIPEKLYPTSRKTNL